MKISYNWLSEFVELKKLKPEQLAKEITEHCFEVEKVISNAEQKFGFSGVVVAKVLHFEKHPNADRLRVAKLDIGGKIIEPVVCGANNFVEGDLVALALPGAVIPQDIHSDSHETFTLTKATIRGVESQGMICSAFELGLVDKPEEKPEILILPKTAKLGVKLEDHLNLKKKKSDIVLDLSLPANRPDLFSHLGIAHEISGILGMKQTAKVAELEKKYATSLKAKKKLEIEIKHPELVPFYSAARIRVKVGPSPDAIREQLEALGLRSINNVVDITNYVMHELGEPLHAFDSKHVQGGIVVRLAHEGEEFTTLDHKTRKLDKHTLMIADHNQGLAIAGIMGGVQSEVTDATEEIILEAANFDPANIRRVSKSLGLRTDASALWEKGLHPKQAVMGMNRAVELLKKYAAAEVLEYAESGKIPEDLKTIKFTASQVNSILGSDFTAAKIKELLTQVGLKIAGVNSMTAEVPYYRTEMYNYADLADEVLKITGTNNLEKKPLVIQKVNLEVNAEQPYNEVKDHMAAMGFNEVQNYSFVSEEEINKFGQIGSDRHLKVKNPLSAEQAYLKRRLIIPMLKNVRDNARYSDAFKIFEVGKGYIGFLDEDDLLTYILYDRNAPKSILLAKIKGYTEELLSKYQVKAPRFGVFKEVLLTVSSGNVEIGNISLLDAKTMRNFGLEGAVAYAKIDLQKLWSASTHTQFSAYSKFPAKVLDVSLVVEKELSWDKIYSVIKQYAGYLLEDVQIFEADYLYTPGKLPDFHKNLAAKGQKNIAFHMVFRGLDKTLTDSEISPIYDKITGELRSKLNAEIR